MRSLLTNHLSGAYNAFEARKDLASGGTANALDAVHDVDGIEHRAKGGLVCSRGPDTGDREVLENNAEFARLDLSVCSPRG